jgi:hypothetical protein
VNVPYDREFCRHLDECPQCRRGLSPPDPLRWQREEPAPSGLCGVGLLIWRTAVRPVAVEDWERLWNGRDG